MEEANIHHNIYYVIIYIILYIHYIYIYIYIYILYPCDILVIHTNIYIYIYIYIYITQVVKDVHYAWMRNWIALHRNNNILNKRTEILDKCRHKSKYALISYESKD